MMNTDWIFYSIYPGRAEYLDDVVKEIVAPAVDRLAFRDDVHQWFFIRYVDMQGPHVRLRFQVDIDSFDAISEELEEWIDLQLGVITSRPLPKMARLIPYNQGSSQEIDSEVNFQLETYEPEYEKYGGVKGIAIAEKCFQSSSRLAISAVKNEQAGTMDRFILALVIMSQSAKQASLSEKERTELWESVLHNWSGADYPGGEKIKESLIVAAAKRRSMVEEKMKSYEQNEEVKKLIAEYCQQIKEAFAEIKVSAQIRLSPSHLMFHYIHMMNNRLGVWPHEEAYLGSLLLALEDKERLPIHL